MSWYFFGGLAAGAAYLFGRGALRKKHQESAARAAGLEPTRGLSHLPESLQHTALWAIADGGFERRVVTGTLARPGGDVTLTAFDLETLRERRGEWAFLPIEPPFRIGGVVSVVVCEVARAFPHVLLKRAGGGDDLRDDTRLERAGHIAKAMRDRLGMGRSIESELPSTLPRAAASADLPEAWRAYTSDQAFLAHVLHEGLAAALERENRRDLVVELLDSLIVVYPAARDVVSADAFADLTTTALVIADGALAGPHSLSPRGVEPTA